MIKLDSHIDLGNVSFKLQVNNKERQHGDVKHMIFNLPALLRHLNSLTPLLPGDLVYTGTPKGVGECRKGDKLHLAFCDGIGSRDGRKASFTSFEGIL